MKQNEIATETLNICTSAIKQELAVEALHNITSAMKQNEIAAESKEQVCSQIIFTLNHTTSNFLFGTLCHCRS